MSRALRIRRKMSQNGVIEIIGDILGDHVTGFAFCFKLKI